MTEGHCTTRPTVMPMKIGRKKIRLPWQTRRFVWSLVQCPAVIAPYVLPAGFADSMTPLPHYSLRWNKTLDHLVVQHFAP
jgi:hypothetical protein